MTKTQKRKIVNRLLLSFGLSLAYTVFGTILPTFKRLQQENISRGGGTSAKNIRRMVFYQSSFTSFKDSRLFSYIKIFLIFGVIIFLILTIITRFTKRK